MIANKYLKITIIKIVEHYISSPCRFGVAFILLLYFTSSLYGQNEKWELGVGLSPLNLQETPASLLLRYHWSDRFALRIGLAGSYTEKSEHHSYSLPHIDSTYLLSYEYLQFDKKLNTRFLLGIQYGKRKSDFFWYGATDLYARFKTEKSEFPEGFLYPGSRVLPPGEVHITFVGPDKITFGLGVRQSVGFQYFINRFVSLSLEGGFFYEWLKVKRTVFVEFARRGELPDTSSGIGYFFLPTVTDKNYAFGISPITFLIFNYHF
jgi:hypothetical protein